MTSMRRREDPHAQHEAHSAPNQHRHPGPDDEPIYRTSSSGSSSIGGTFGRHITEPPPQSATMGFEEEAGVEVVLDHGASKIVEESPPRPPPGGQDVFRGPQTVQRPRAVRAPRPPPPHGSSGSFGAYGPPPPPPPRGEPRPQYANQVPYDPANGSFEDGAYYQQRHQQSHYSPQVHYPPPGGYPNEDVNVISPNHKAAAGGDPRYNRPPPGPQSRQYYRYPPTSPVSRPNNSPPRSKHHPPPPSQVSSRRGEGPYSSAQRGVDTEAYHPNDGTFNSYGSDRPQTALVTESSFDSEPYGGSHHSHYGSHPPTPAERHTYSQPPTPQQSGDVHGEFYGGNGSWHSFDGGAMPPPPHFDDQRYYGYPPESPYYQDAAYLETPYPNYGPDGRPYSDDPLLDYHPDAQEPVMVSPEEKNRKNKDNKSSSGILLPKAAQEVDFEVTKPPPEPVTPPGTVAVCDSLAQVNHDDVLCGRGGGTNSQIGNRRFRQLVQEFQPTYLLARRKEKPLLARTIVLIIRKRGGRFLKKNDDTGELFEVGDAKAEAKTSQALREGLDVRATKSAAKNKKKGGKGSQEDASATTSPAADKKSNSQDNGASEPPPSPPPMPRLQGEQVKSGIVHPHSPEALNFRKRRRMRSKEGAVQNGCGVFQDKLFMDFCPPRADLGRPASPSHDYHDPMDVNTPPRANYSREYEDDPVYGEQVPAPGCTDIAMSAMMGAAMGSFCLGPSKWRNA